MDMPNPMKDRPFINSYMKLVYCCYRYELINSLDFFKELIGQPREKS